MNGRLGQGGFAAECRLTIAFELRAAGDRDAGSPEAAHPGPSAAQRAPSRELTALGWTPELAVHLALQPEERPIAASLANQLTRTARLLHGRERATALWREAGLSPGRRPLGAHARRYAGRLHPLIPTHHDGGDQ